MVIKEDILKGYGGIAMGVMAREKETEAKEFDYEMEIESLQKQIGQLQYGQKKLININERLNEEINKAYGERLKLRLRIERLEADALLMVETITKIYKALK